MKLSFDETKYVASGCYVLACDCQSGPNACRVLTAGGGAVGAQGTPPQYSDPAVDCEGKDRACLLPEQVCVGVGASCTGECVRAGAVPDGGDLCQSSSERFRPMRGEGGVPRCPYPSDVCCSPPDGAACAPSTTSRC